MVTLPRSANYLEAPLFSVQRICFVCLVNIVRSPLAENLFIHLADQTGVAGSYEVDSAGTSAWHIGEPPDSRMRREAARHGLRYDGRSRQFQHRDLDRYDLILAMDKENHDDLSNMARTPEQGAKIHLLRDYDPRGGANLSVPDPYYAGRDAFEEVYVIIERSVRGLLQQLEAGRRGNK